MSQAPTLESEMVDDGGQPEAPQSETPLAPRDYGDLLGDNLRAPAPEVEPDQPTAEPEPLAPSLPQTAEEWFTAVLESPGREDQIPGKFRAEFRRLRDDYTEQRIATAVQQARNETASQAEQRVIQQMALARDVATVDSWLDEESPNYDPLKFTQWMKANPQGHNAYAAYKANAEARPATRGADPLAVIHEQNQDVINAWNSRPDLVALVRTNVAAGKYGADAVGPDGNWTPRGLVLALRDVAPLLTAPKETPDPAATAVEQRQAAATERGAIPRTASGGAPSGGGVTVAQIKGTTDPLQLLALKKRDPEGYERAVVALSQR